jgi:hypothetical protein
MDTYIPWTRPPTLDLRGGSATASAGARPRFWTGGIGTSQFSLGLFESVGVMSLPTVRRYHVDTTRTRHWSGLGWIEQQRHVGPTTNLQCSGMHGLASDNSCSNSTRSAACGPASRLVPYSRYIARTMIVQRQSVRPSQSQLEGVGVRYGIIYVEEEALDNLGIAHARESLACQTKPASPLLRLCGDKKLLLLLLLLLLRLLDALVCVVACVDFVLVWSSYFSRCSPFRTTGIDSTRLD